MKKLLYILLGITLFLSSCEKLEVENTNEPDRSKILSNSRDLKIFANNIYLTYWQYIKGDFTSNIQIASLCAADQFTASWENFSCRDLSYEPRIPYKNSVNYEWINQTYSFYSGMYTVLYMSNTLINQINSGSKLSPDSATNMGYLSMAYFMQGLALGELGITFDKAQIVKENTNAEKLDFSRYDAVIDSAVASLDKAAEIAQNYKFDLGKNIINGISFTSDLVYRASHSYAARFLILSARTVAENNQTRWIKVLQYTNPSVSINQDFGPYGDGGNKWSDRMMDLLTNVDNTSYFFAKVDNRIIHLMDNAYPAHYPANGRAPRVHSDKRLGEASSGDKRLAKYFEFSNSVKFLPERGTYHYSLYRFKRFDNIRLSQSGQFVELSVYENALMYIEAAAMLNGTGIVPMINALLPRKEEGGLPNLPANADKKTILETVFYEREIELLGQSYLMGFCDMRRRNLLQKGTPLHFPVPAPELQVLQKDVYTFGGVDNADGTNTSNGGW